MPLVYRADPSTGTVFETKEYKTPAEKKELLKGDWMETPRWKFDPNPHGPDADDIFKRSSDIPIPPFPCVVYGKDLKQGQAKDAEDLKAKIAEGWSEKPIPEIWQRGEQTHSVATLQDRHVVLNENAEIRKGQRTGAIEGDDLLWVKVEAPKVSLSKKA